jgi:hypothetical protein
MQDSKLARPATKRSALRHSVTIDATFGSEMQRDVALRLLDQLLASWKEMAESHHKKNVIKIIRES